MDLEKINTACLICGSGNLKELPEYDKANLIKCRNCDFVFCKKKPSNEDLKTNYDNYPRSNDISPITITRYNELLDKYDKYRKTNNILDVGCGDGHFLKVAKEKGWNVYGTEFTDKAVEVCLMKGINIKKGVLNILNYENIQFDIVTSFEVIEHINNPVEEINKFSKLLRKGGLLYITTPNFNSVSRYILKQKWNIIEYPEHLCYYTKKTLTKVVVENGFSKLNFETTGFSFSRFQNSMDIKTPQANTINKDNLLRQKTETKLLYKIAKKSINFILTIFSKGDAIKATFVNN